MKTAVIHYFSGTGNTFRVASIVKKKLEGSGYEVRLHSVEAPGDQVAPDLDVFAFPVYAYDVPDIMMSFIRRLPPVHNRKAAVIAVHGMLWQKPIVPGDGGDPGYSFEHARRALSRKGFAVDYTMAVGYPHSISMLLNTPAPAEIMKIREASDKRVEAFSENIASNTISLQRCSILAILISIVPGIGFSIFGRRGLGKLFVADRACVKCGKCVDSCPSGALRLFLGRPRWNWKCQGCQRCINSCPQKSVQMSLARLSIMVGGIFVPWDSLVYGLLPAIPAGLFQSILLWAVLYFVFIYVADKLLFLLEAMPVIGKVMSLNLSSSNRRYLDPMFRAAAKEESAIKAEIQSR